MATVTKGKTFTSGETVVPAKLHELVDNATVTNIVNADISASAAITASKLQNPQYTGFRNAIINGNFDIWQRGTTAATFGYLADRWNTSINGSTCSVSRQAFTIGQTDVPNEPAYFYSNTVTSSAGAGNFVAVDQRIEDVRTFAGQNVVVSFYAKADASKPIAVELVQNFGTGGSPSSQVVGIGITKTTLSTSWQKITVTASIPAISGNLGSDGNSYLRLIIWLDAGSNFNSRTDTLGQQSGTFDIAQVQVEAGSVATPFERRPIGTELALCQRYYFTGRGLFRGAGGGGSAHFPVEMRANPTVTTGAIDAGTGGTWGVLGKQAVFEQVANSTGSGATFTASAEL